MMSHLPSEVLLPIFKDLDSKEMVKVTRVCKSWFQTIEANKALWRRLVLQDRREGWKLSTLELFDRKSESSLEHAEMRVSDEVALRGQVGNFLDTLERSKETLHTILLSGRYGTRSQASEVWFKFPQLIDFRIIDSSGTERIRLTPKGTQEPKNYNSSLKILWITEYQKSFESHFHLLDNLSSLSIGMSIDQKDLRNILEIPSQKLKHLDISLGYSLPTEELPLLNFPQLQVLEIHSFKFPSWMKIPASSTIIAVGYTDLSWFPSVSTIWTDADNDFESLSNRCPGLFNLHVDKRGDVEDSWEPYEGLLEMLADRRTNATKALKVDGVEMVAIETLSVPFSCLSHDQISRLKSLVNKVLDVETLPRFIEVEI